MGFLLFIGAIVLGIISWIVWAIFAVVIAFAVTFIPWIIWDYLMRLTFYNVINCIAKLPSFIGVLLGFLFTLPFAAVGIGISLWAYTQSLLIALLTFRGDPNTEFCAKFVETCIGAFESDGFHHMIIARFYYEHCQWLWGGAGFMHSYYPWQNGCGTGVWFGVGNELPIPVMIIKLLLLALPYMFMFILPILPVLWSFTRPIVGAMAKLPAISGNGDGRD